MQGLELVFYLVCLPVGLILSAIKSLVIFLWARDRLLFELPRIVRADTYLEANSPGGSNEQRHARAIVIFLFTYWEDEIRFRLAAAKNVPVNEIKSDIMGDFRILRHAILHAKSSIRPDEHKRLKVVGSMFPPSTPIHISYDDMHQLFVLIKQDCARLMFSWLGVKDGPVSPEQLVDVAIQRGNK